MNCSKCGALLKPNANFCPKCGKVVNFQEQQPRNLQMPQLQEASYSTPPKSKKKKLMAILVGIIAMVLCAGVVTLVAVHKRSNSNEQSSAIPDDAIYLNQHAYAGFSYNMSWDEAEEYCTSLGGHLISINSQEEQDLALEIAKEIGKENIWTGGYLESDSWKWTDGSEFQYTNWDNTSWDDSKEVMQPDNRNGTETRIRFVSCNIEYIKSHWKANEGKWNDISPTGDDEITLDSFGFICEWTDVD